TMRRSCDQPHGLWAAAVDALPSAAASRSTRVKGIRDFIVRLLKDRRREAPSRSRVSLAHSGCVYSRSSRRMSCTRSAEASRLAAYDISRARRATDNEQIPGLLAILLGDSLFARAMATPVTANAVTRSAPPPPTGCAASLTSPTFPTPFGVS